jgi:hypothetical protein
MGILRTTTNKIARDFRIRPRRSLLVIALIIAIGVMPLVGSGSGKSSNPNSASVMKKFQKKNVKPDPPGTIDGAQNPQAIPDHAAYGVVLRMLMPRQNSDFEERRALAWAQTAGLDYAAAIELYAVATEFGRRIKPVDQQINEVKNRSTWPDPDEQTKKQLSELNKQKEQIVIELIASMPTKMGVAGAAQFQRVINEKIKRKMKIVPGLQGAIRHH